MTELIFPLATRRATEHLARSILRVAAPSDLIVLTGQLGSGKTFLVRAVCQKLSVQYSFQVTSPTFSLVHEYPSVPPIVHADLYRLSTEREVLALGLVEQRDLGKILFVEWGEPYVLALGGDAIVVALDLSPRRATIRATGPISEERITGLL